MLQGVEKYNRFFNACRTIVAVSFFVVFALAIWSWVGTNTAKAGVPPVVITYQGKLLTNNLAATTTQSMTFVLYTADTGGSAVYTAAGTVGAPSAISVTPVNGIFTVNLGGSGTNGLDAGIFQDNSLMYLEVTIGGQTLTPRKQITSAPYAFNAKYLDGIAANIYNIPARYIPVSDDSGNFNFNHVSTTGGLFADGLVTTNGSVVASGGSFADVLGGVGDTLQASGDGARMIWYAKKAAFRAGVVTGSGWDDANIGLVSTAFGVDAISSGSLSFAMGQNVTSSGDSAVAFGYNNVASGNGSVVFGENNYSTGDNSFVVGDNNYGTNADSVAIGYGVSSTGYASFALGQNVGARGNNSFALGTKLQVSGMNSFGLNVGNDDFVVDADNVIALLGGKVGIGTVNPISQLDVASNVPSVAYASTTLAVADPNAIAVQGSYAYVVSGTSTPGSLSIYNIDSPTPLLVSSTSDFTYISSPIKVIVEGRYAYIGNIGPYASVTIYDISNPAAPTFVSNYQVSVGAAPVGMVLQGKHLYVATNLSDFKVIDVSNPYTPVLLGSSTIVTDAKDLVVKGSYAYVVASSTLQIFNIANPYNIVQVANNTTVVGAGHTPQSIAVDGAYAYVASSYGPGDDLRIINISNPASPALVATTSVMIGGLGNPKNIVIQGNNLYLTTINNHQLQIFDITHPTLPTRTADFYSSADTRGIAVKGRYVYAISNPDTSMFVFDIGSAYIQQLEVGGLQGGYLSLTNALSAMDGSFIGNLSVGQHLAVSGGIAAQATSSFLGSISVGTTTPREKLHLVNGTLLVDSPGNLVLKGSLSGTDTRGVYVSGKYAYTADRGANLLRVIDIANPASPVQVGTVPVSGANGVFVSGKYAYVAGFGDGVLRVVDVSIPNVPIIVGSSAYLNDNPYDVYVSGRYAYVATLSQGLKIIDVSNPLNPVVISTYNSGNVTDARSVYVSGKYAYVSNFTSARLSILDISNPYSVSLVGEYSSLAGPMGSYVSGKYLYIADYTGGLKIVDVSDPGSPTTVGSVTSGMSFANAVFAAGKYVYLADWSGNQVIAFDVSNPSAPVQVGAYTGGAAFRLAVVGKYAYVAGVNGGLGIIDLLGADISAASIGSIATNALTVSENVDIGNNLYVRNGLNVGIGGLYSNGAVSIFATSSSALSVFGTSTFNGIVVVSSTSPTTAFSVFGTSTFSGNKFFLDASGNVSSSGTLKFFSASTLATTTVNGYFGVGTTSPQQKLHLYNGTLLVDGPTNPTLIGTQVPFSDYRNVYISGKYAYMADNTSGLQIIDISNPASPVYIGSYDTSGNAYGVFVSGKYAYVADFGSGLQIIDVSNPMSPTLVSTYNTDGLAYNVYVSGKYAYVADYTAGLQVINISNPAIPTLAGNYPATSAFLSVYVSGKYAYAADDTTGLRIIDVSNPAIPVLTGTYNTAASATGVYVSGKYAYVADSSTLQIINIANSFSPSFVGEYDTTGYASSVYVSGKYAYVVNDIGGLQIIDVSVPAAPSLVGAYDTTGTALGVHVSGRYAYVADGASGLQIIDIFGADIHAAAIGNLSSNDLTVTENVDIGNNLYIRNGLNIGAGGLYSGGAVSIYNTSSLSLAVFGTSTFVGGNVGIGTTTPLAAMHISASSSVAVSIFDKVGQDGTIISLRRDNTEQGTISVSGATVSYNAFTGSHYATLPGGVTDIQEGMLVRMTGQNARFHDDAASEIIYGVTSTAIVNDSKVLGSYLSLQSSGGYTTNNPHLIMAVGNGEMWVSDNGQDLDSGDYLISSAVSGHAMKDVGDFDLSYIIGRAAESVTWADVTTTVNGVKHVKISVFYENFVRDNRLTKTFTIDTASTTVALGTASTSLTLKLAKSLSFTDPVLNNVSFAGAGTFTSLIDDGVANRAFTFNAAGFSQSANTSIATFSAQGTPVLNIQSNGDLLTNGTIKANQFITGTSTLDLAETYPVDQSCSASGTCPEAGDTVCLVAGQSATIEKCSLPYSEKAIGIVSTKPGFTLGDASDSAQRKVALAGRVPVKVSNKNGQIKVGDRLTTSDEPGVAMKAADNGPTIGIALADYYGTNDGTVLAFVKMGWWSPLNMAGPNTQNAGGITLANLAGAVIDVLRNIGVTIENGVVKASQFIADKITSGQVDTQKLCVDSVCVTKDQFKDLLDKNNIVSVGETPTTTPPVIDPVVVPTPPPTSTPDTGSPSSTPEVVDTTPTTTPATPPVEVSPVTEPTLPPVEETPPTIPPAETPPPTDPVSTTP